MTSRRIALNALAIATALTAFAAPASAQRIDHIVAFGDSYADDNNIIQYLLASPFVSAGTKAQLQQTFPTGRFSGGTNYVDTLSQLLNAPVDNFALGGALANNASTFGFPLGFTTEVNSFLAGGGSATGILFPTVSPSFSEGDLLTLSIGGNDGRVYQQSGGSLAGAPAAGVVAAASATANLNLLVGAGAPTISYLAVNTATAPEVANDPNPANAVAVRNAFSNSFNSSFRQTLAGYAANGVTVHYLDGGLLATQVGNNLSAYGFTGLVCPANATCIASDAAARGYLFYVDGLHLTSHGFEVVAQYIAAQLEAPLTFQAASDNSLDVAHQWGRTLTSRMDLVAPRDGDQPEGVHAYIVGDTAVRTVNAGPANEQFRSATRGVTAGVEFGFGSGLVGVAANYSSPRINFGNDRADARGRTVQVGGYASFGVAGLFGQGYIGAGRDRLDLERDGVVTNLTASPHGNHVVGGIKGGYLVPLGAVRIGPVIGLDYARAKLDGYTESGDPVLTLNVDKVSYKSLRGSLGAEVRGDFGGNGVQVRPYLAVTAEKDFKGDGRTFTFSQTSAPEIVNTFAVEDGSKHIYGRLTAGGSARILDNLGLDVSLSTTQGKDQGNETSAHLGFRVGF